MLVLVPAIYKVLAAFKMPPVIVVVPIAYRLPTAASKAMVPVPVLMVRALAPVLSLRRLQAQHTRRCRPRVPSYIYISCHATRYVGAK